MIDTIEKISDCTVQHGAHNDRVYLIKLAEGCASEMISHVEQLAQKNNYSKIFAKVPEWALAEFQKSGYMIEAVVPRFYDGAQDGFFIAKYLDALRWEEQHPDTVSDVLATAKEKAEQSCDVTLDTDCTMDVVGENDVLDVCSVYKQVFESYPFPIHDPNYIIKTMKESSVYFCIRKDGEIISVASSEMDAAGKNVEMTDFATMRDYRGSGFASLLLGKMEQEMALRGMKTAYTIARSLSYGMNITFAKQGYQYAGTLTNNTNICGHMESMNVWYKHLT